jgi:hypothetical protein
MRTREEHIEHCKRQAREYLEEWDIPNAITVMLSELGKHPETRAAGASMALMGMYYITEHDMDGAKRFIEGFR